ncbi:hypothetical protein KUCAC02_000203 [Chaenocephalus aceratus]|uniref:Uncharacterized protein n=1 Tax=Chaenocephalus aceratus TaxID=36190 RepID=A0ACB9W561_CHAAC|nr:hypothetical protein KUCAC02_000203 [Chaenocephalus aceratus]
MALFPRGVSYKTGGVDSGFRRTQGSGTVQRLYQIKGKRNIRAREVELSWSSFNKGDCFILDLGEIIVSWIGSQANMFEKQKVREIASLIRDTERHGKAKIVDSNEGEEPEEMLKVLGKMPQLAESTPEEDSKADASNSASLYKVSDATGSMTMTIVSEKSPFAKDLLVRDDCFILDNGANGKIFVWKGKGANAEEKQSALKMADNFIEQMKYPRRLRWRFCPREGDHHLQAVLQELELKCDSSCTRGEDAGHLKTDGIRSKIRFLYAMTRCTYLKGTEHTVAHFEIDRKEI